MVARADHEFDVAFSFLADDEALATQIADLLRDRMRVFLYGERQKELAGKDGVEEFASVFRRKARICAVLYRDGWGKTKWTRIEETAIKSRGFDDDFGFLFVINLGTSQPRDWIPAQRLWLALDRFGINGAAGAIEARVQEKGGSPHGESVAEKAQRLAKQVARERGNDAFLNSQRGVDAALDMVAATFAFLRESVDLVLCSSAPPDIQFFMKNERVCFFRAGPTTLVVAWSQQWQNTLDHASLLISRYERLNSFDGPKGEPLEQRRFALAIDETGNVAWRCKNGGGPFLTPRQLADELVKEQLDRGYRKNARDEED